jgi:NAD-dependent dihydropyrimidine dehydrogenase PreA subunit
MIYIQSQQCVGCGACVDACQVGAIQLVNGVAEINQDKCQQCEICLTVCPENAIVAVLDEEPVSDTRSFDLMQPERTAVQLTHSTSSIAPWVGAALAFIGREIMPRLAVSLLDIWDRRTTQPTSPSGAILSSAQKNNETPLSFRNNGGHRHRRRRRGL